MGEIPAAELDSQSSLSVEDPSSRIGFAVVFEWGNPINGATNMIEL